jgi:hypothetical protein
VAALPFNLSLLGNSGTPHPPTRLLMPFCAIGCSSPDTALGALPNMSVQLRNPGRRHPARGSPTPETGQMALKLGAAQIG